MSEEDPLTELVKHLEEHGAPALAWVLAHAPDNSLDGLWERCNDPVALLYLLQRARGVPFALELLLQLRAAEGVPRPGPFATVRLEKDPALWLAVAFKHPGEEPELWLWDHFRPRRHAPTLCSAIRARVSRSPALTELVSGAP